MDLEPWLVFIPALLTAVAAIIATRTKPQPEPATGDADDRPAELRLARHDRDRIDDILHATERIHAKLEVVRDHVAGIDGLRTSVDELADVVRRPPRNPRRSS